ncbi:MAG TPA: imidazole glycerol phosphate synthase subunit HisH [Candidatus Dormibacteraeota bacterium]
MSPRIGVCDYGVGNLHSVERALVRAGAEPVISGVPAELESCDGLVLPGVGAFVAAAEQLRRTGMDRFTLELVRSGRPLLGVCLGYQLLFEHSDEGAGADGLGLIAGQVTRVDARGLKLPQIGWNQIRRVRDTPLLDGVPDGTYVYFVHSYGATPDDEADAVAVTDYGATMVAAVQRGGVMGTQFHPEKSGAAGLRLYFNFVALCAASRASAVAR